MFQDLIQQNSQRVTRRQFFGRTSAGVGTAALASLMGQDGMGEVRPSHFAPKAKRIVLLWQGGGPSHIDLFDHKPVLAKQEGVDIPASVRGDTRLSAMSANYSNFPCVPAIKPYARYGKSGMELSTMIPNTGAIADDICLVRSLHTEAVNHAPGVTFFLTGGQIPGRPSMGSWLSYGLGSESENLPSFVVMTSSDEGRTCGQLFYDHYWGSGFLPSRYQGVRLRSAGEPVPYLSNPPGVSRETRRTLLDDMARMNQKHLEDYGDPETETRISQYEMAFRMQASVPELTDFSGEHPKVMERYGPKVHQKGSYANNCLIARRLLERGTRFVQLMHSGWDQHANLYTQLEEQCRDTDAPSAALVMDLKERGLLEDTLVIFAGEFGRTPFGQSRPGQPNSGRDHFGRAFSWWMAGGGVKAGTTFGSTDEYGWNITEDPIHVHDMQATILHLAGINHTKLTYRYQGRQFRLTDVHGHVQHGILA